MKTETETGVRLLEAKNLCHKNVPVARKGFPSRAFRCAAIIGFGERGDRGILMVFYI